MKYMVFDSETQIYKSRKRTANPFDERNWVVARGWKVQGDPQNSWEYYPERSRRFLKIPHDVGILVGHNIKFDLLYEMVCGNLDLIAFFKRGGKIWCTQYAEYLLRAQDKKYHYCAMDDIIEDYGGRRKIDGIKALWEAGVQTSDINEDMLIDYLVGTEDEHRGSGDIGNTELIFNGQVKEAIATGMINAIMARMDGLACTTEMEFNGVYVDTAVALMDLRRLNAEMRDVGKELERHLPEMPTQLTFNWNSPIHKSALIFGGTIKYSWQTTYVDPETGELARLKAKEAWPLFDGEPVHFNMCAFDEEKGLYQQFGVPVGDGDEYIEFGEYQDTYKSGKKKGQGKFKQVPVPGELKVKFQDFTHTLPGFTKGYDEWKTETTDAAGGPVYSTGSEILEALENTDIPFLKAVGRRAALNKEIGTYYVQDDGKGNLKGMLTCVDPTTSIVHHGLNHVSTVTSRLSSSDPNLQNIPRADFDQKTGKFKSRIKAMFVSRFGEEGCMVEADYSQLEVIVQGLLSGDKQLILDIINGVDFHCKRVALKCGITYEDAVYFCKDENAPDHAKWKIERTHCKIFSFQRAYGAGAVLIALSTGMDVDDVKALMKAEDLEYPGVVAFNEAVEAEVTDTAVPFRDAARGYRAFRKGTWQAPTGTLYGWRSWDAPTFLRQRGITDTFKPTELKNYPVQGTGGEIVQLILGRLWRHFVANGNYGGKAFLVNTVHDCIWIDCHKSVKVQVGRDIKRIMEDVKGALKETYDMDCPVPFRVDVEEGMNMLEMHHLEM